MDRTESLGRPRELQFGGQSIDRRELHREKTLRSAESLLEYSVAYGIAYSYEETLRAVCYTNILANAARENTARAFVSKTKVRQPRTVTQ